MEDLLLCVLCNGELKEPKTLTCCHSYCFCCLQQHAAGGEESISCLKCGKVTAMPSGGLSALERNPLLDALLSQRDQLMAIRETSANLPKDGYQKTLTEMEHNGIKILPEGTVFSEFRHDKKDALMYTLFYRKNGNEVQFQYAANLFTKLAKLFNFHELEDSQSIRSDIAIWWIAIDTDKCQAQAIDKTIKENDIILWDANNCRILPREKIEQLEYPSSIAFIKYNSTVKPSQMEFTPSSRAGLKMICPIQGCDDSKTEWNWHCVFCLSLLEYDYDADRIFCDCGAWVKALIDPLYDASCGNSSQKFTTILHSQLRGTLQQLLKVKDLNILVLGETGVGKSTWINAVANYVTSTSLDEAMSDSKFQCLIESNIKRSSGWIPRSSKVKVQVTNKPEDPLLGLIGESDTKIPSSYIIPTNKYNVRLIDTPGVCDTRGKDEENCQNILYYLANAPFDELHGICILIKCGQKRLSESFKYCLNQLFKQLHKSAADNLIFAFTFSRTSYYTKDDTFDILNRTLSDIGRELDKIISAELNKNVFFLDNEIFEYLCLARTNAKFDEIQVTDKRRSWDISKRESDRLFQYVESIDPYNKKNSSSIYYARQLITKIIPPTLSLRLTLERNRESMQEAKDQHGLGSEIHLYNKILFKKEEQTSEQLPSTSSLCKSCTTTTIVNDDLDNHEQEYHITKKICATNIGTWNWINRILWKIKNRRAEHCPTCPCPENYHERTASSEKRIIKYCFVENIQNLQNEIDAINNSLWKITSNSARLSFFLQNSVLAEGDDIILQELENEELWLVMPCAKDTDKDKDAEDKKAKDIELVRKVKEKHMKELKKCEGMEILNLEKVVELCDELYQIPSFGSELKRRVENDESARAKEVSKEEIVLKRWLSWPSR